MNTRKILVVALIMLIAALPAFAVPSAMVYTGRIVRPGNADAKVFENPTFKSFKVEIKNAQDRTIWAIENVQVLVQTNGMFTIELSDAMNGVKSNDKSLKDLCAGGEASQIVAEITGTTYMSRDELVTVPLVDTAAVAESLTPGGDAFILGNLNAREIIVRNSAEIDNLTISNSLKTIGNQSLNIGEIDYSKLNELKLAVTDRGNYAESRVFNRKYFLKRNCIQAVKKYEEYTYNQTLLISCTNPNAKMYTDGKKSGILVITGSSMFPGVSIPFSGEDIKWPFETIPGNQRVTLYFFPFGTNR